MQGVLGEEMTIELMRVIPNGITPSSPPLPYPKSSHSIRCIREEMDKVHHAGQQQYSYYTKQFKPNLCERQPNSRRRWNINSWFKFINDCAETVVDRVCSALPLNGDIIFVGY